MAKYPPPNSCSRNKMVSSRMVLICLVVVLSFSTVSLSQTNGQNTKPSKDSIPALKPPTLPKSSIEINIDSELASESESDYDPIPPSDSKSSIPPSTGSASAPQSTSHLKPSMSPSPSSEPDSETEPEDGPTPSSKPKPTPAPSSEPDSETEPEDGPAPSSKPKPTPAPSSKPKPTPAPSSEPDSETDPDDGPAPSSEPKPTPAPSSEPKPTPAPSSEPNSEAEPPTEQDDGPAPSSKPKPSATPSSEPESPTESDDGSAPSSEPGSSPTPSSKPKPAPEPSSAPTESDNGPNSTTGPTPEPKQAPNQKQGSESPPQPTTSEPTTKPAFPYQTVNNFCLYKRLSVNRIFCLKVLKNPIAANATVDDYTPLLQVATLATTRHVIKTLKYLKTLYKDKAADPAMKPSIRECVIAYQEIAEYIKLVLADASQESAIAGLDGQVIVQDINRCVKAVPKSKNTEIGEMNNIARNYAKLLGDIADNP